MDLMTESSEAGDHPFKEPGNPENSVQSSKVLPVLALNEIYIGESLSSRVSYLELKVTPKKDAFLITHVITNYKSKQQIKLV